jgi:hypothetical protein
MPMRVQKDGQYIEIGAVTVPTRKSKALVVESGMKLGVLSFPSSSKVLAYFRSDEAAKEFEDALDWIIKGYEQSSGLDDAERIALP